MMTTKAATKHKATKVYIFKVQIRVDNFARGGIYDMLRYDSCCPDSEMDSVKLARVTAGANTGRLPADRTLTLRMFGLTPKGPTVERWKSFGVTVLDVERIDR